MTRQIRVANAPVSWGALEFELGREGLGFEHVLDEIRDTGYMGTELGDWGFLPTDPQVLRQELSKRELDLVGAFVPVNLLNPDAHSEGTARALRTAKLMAQAVPESEPLIVLSDDNARDASRTAIAGRVRHEDGLDNEAWQVFASGAQQIAGEVRRQTGLRTAFHHHCAGFVETPWEIAALMQRTDPGLLGLCLDTGHYRFGGGDPVEAAREYGDRIWHVHFKDCDPAIAARAAHAGWDYFQAVEHGVFCELGEGDVDFPAVAAQLEQSGYQGWIVVEQDVLPGMGAPRESARRNRVYLEQIGVGTAPERTRSESA